MHGILLSVAGLAVRTFYRWTHLGGSAPAEGPALVVANHPNGLVDPIVVALVAGRPVRFLAKEPLFRTPVIAWLVRGIGAIPVWRPSDGADTTRNEATFAAVRAALEAGDAICLFPEGTSHSKPYLQRLKTGAARMALGAAAGSGAEVAIVPVGLVYREKWSFRSRLASRVGAPIRVDAALRDLQARDERAAVLALTDRIAEGLRAVTLQLDSWEELPAVELAEAIWPPSDADRVERMRRLASGLRALRERDPPRARELLVEASDLRDTLDRLGLAPRHLDARHAPGAVARFVLENVVALGLGLPLGCLGAALWIVPYQLVRLCALGVATTADTVATVKLLASLALFPLWYALAVAAALAWAPPLAALALAVAAPFAGVLALRVRERGRAVAREVAVFLRLVGRASLRDELERRRDALLAAMEEASRLLPARDPAGAAPGGESVVAAAPGRTARPEN